MYQCFKKWSEQKQRFNNSPWNLPLDILCNDKMCIALIQRFNRKGLTGRKTPTCLPPSREATTYWKRFMNTLNTLYTTFRLLSLLVSLEDACPEIQMSWNFIFGFSKEINCWLQTVINYWASLMCVGFLSLRFCTLECWLSGLSGLQVETCFIKQSLNFFLIS